jgi:hypothetical protein
MLYLLEIIDKSDVPSIRLEESSWQAIAAHDFNIPSATSAEAAALTFEGRLARENNWDSAHTARVIEEYRRFLYLAVHAGHPVTPSDAVDQAWHLHLVYTRNYWDILCGEVLGRPLHHGPTRGGDAEASKFTDWYDHTLASYRAHFRAAPPADIWPPPHVRFAAHDRFQRVDTAQHWVIPKPNVRATATLVASAAAPFVVLSHAVGGAWAGWGNGVERTDALVGPFCIALVVHAVLLMIGKPRLAMLLSFGLAYLAILFQAPLLLARPDLIFWGVAIWLVFTLVLTRMFYRRKTRRGRSDAGASQGCGGGCMVYLGDSGGGSHGGGSGGSDGSAGGDSGGSGCGGGCGGGD